MVVKRHSKQANDSLNQTNSLLNTLEDSYSMQVHSVCVQISQAKLLEMQDE
jgi:hypothetical protein